MSLQLEGNNNNKSKSEEEENGEKGSEEEEDNSISTKLTIISCLGLIGGCLGDKGPASQSRLKVTIIYCFLRILS